MGMSLGWVWKRVKGSLKTGCGLGRSRNETDGFAFAERCFRLPENGDGWQQLRMADAQAPEAWVWRQDAMKTAADAGWFFRLP
nr:hypothetical protein [uncultured Kingella sp.]